MKRFFSAVLLSSLVVGLALPAWAAWPTTPTGQAVSCSTSGCLVSWTADTIPPTPIGYDVLRSNTNSGTYVQLNTTPINGTSFLDTTVAAGKKYFYKIRGVGSPDGTTGLTSSVSGTVPTAPPPPPPPAVVSVSVAPISASLVVGGNQQFTATVTGATDTSVTWSATCGTVSTAGFYTATVEGACNVTATSVADATKSATATVDVSVAPPPPPPPVPPTGDPTVGLLPSDRSTAWVPGMMAVGGIPNRTIICKTVNPPASGNATATIQAAIDACPEGQVVQLAAGTYTINGGDYLLLDKGVTLRGAGPDKTILQKTDGAKPGTEAVGANPSPIIIVGAYRWDPSAYGIGSTSINFSADGAKGSKSITLASTPALVAGDLVLVDELSGAAWQTDPEGRGQVWASPDFLITWQHHNPGIPGQDDPFPNALSWFMRTDRPTSEYKEVESVSGTTVTFTTPLHIAYRTSHTAQVSWNPGAVVVKRAGVEDLKVIGGDNGNIRFHLAKECWAKGVENTVWHDEGFSFDNTFRIEVRHSYIHDAAWAQPGGGGYAISLSNGTSEALFEDNIIIKANKVMVARSSGAGTVYGYNYADDGYINTNGAWIEVGLNASHMVGPHHVLFEGNQSFNWDSDVTHGNSTNMTAFRNYVTGIRAPFTNQLGGNVDDSTQSGNGPMRCFGAMAYSYWMSFLGNVCGIPGKMSGWNYETNFGGPAGVWMLGWDGWVPYPTDTKVTTTAIRHGNYDYLTNSVKWDPTITQQSLPPSFYLTAKPAFFGSYTWPWVDPAGATKLYTLPAKARYDAGTPFAP